MHITTIGLDIAKNIFQVHAVTESGTVAFNRPLRRARSFPEPAINQSDDRMAAGLVKVTFCRGFTRVGATPRRITDEDSWR